MPGGANGPSPALLCLIEDHRQALQATRSAELHHDAAYERFEALEAKEIAEFLREWPEKWEIDLGAPAACRQQLVLMLNANRQVMTCAQQQASASTRRKFAALWKNHVAQVLAAFDKMVERVEAARESFGILPAVDALEAAENAEDDLIMQICAFPCATLADARAKAGFLRTIRSKGFSESGRLDALLRSLAGDLAEA